MTLAFDIKGGRHLFLVEKTILVITCDPTTCRMDHPGFNTSNFMVYFIGTKRVNIRFHIPETSP